LRSNVDGQENQYTITKKNKYVSELQVDLVLLLELNVEFEYDTLVRCFTLITPK